MTRLILSIRNVTPKWLPDIVVPVERAGKAKMDDLATKAVLPKNLLNTIEQLIDLVPGIPPPTIRVKFALERNRKNRTSEKM